MNAPLAASEPSDIKEKHDRYLALYEESDANLTYEQWLEDQLHETRIYAGAARRIADQHLGLLDSVRQELERVVDTLAQNEPDAHKEQEDA